MQRVLQGVPLAYEAAPEEEAAEAEDQHVGKRAKVEGKSKGQSKRERKRLTQGKEPYKVLWAI